MTGQNKDIDFERFAQIVIEKWQNMITSLNITDTGVLYNSFASAVHRDANGRPDLITFTMQYYGRFLDMGVFGTGSRALRTAVKHKREVRRWYNSVFPRQVHALSYLLVRYYGHQAGAMVKDNLEKKPASA